MVRRSRQSSFGVNADSGAERHDNRPGYRRNTTTISKLSRRGNTSAKGNLRDSSMSQFTGQINSHGIHLHVRVTAHPNGQSVQRSAEPALQSHHSPNHVQLSGPNIKTQDSLQAEKHSPGRHYGGHLLEGETGMVTVTPQGSGRVSRKSQQRRLPPEAVLPPIEGGITGKSTHIGPNEFPAKDVPLRQPSLGTPTMRSPGGKPLTDKQGRGLTRDKTVSTMESVKFPECSPVASGIRRRRKKNSFLKEHKEKVLSIRPPKHSQQQHQGNPPFTDVTKKPQAGHVPDVQERAHDNVNEDWKLYSSHSNLSHEPFSIRKKIEQFKKWHEEQNREKLQRLEQSVVRETNSVQENKVADETSTLKSCGETDYQEGSKNRKETERISRLPELPPQRSSRPKSARTWVTWRTWRGVNDSYAYNDAKKYIEENELLTGEKEHWIQQWIDDVDREFFSNGRMELCSSTSGDSSGGMTV